MIDHYDWAGGREAMLRFGPAGGPVVIATLPLFEEANRTRSFLVAILRALGEQGIGGVLPDLPGTGESLVPTARMRLADLRAAHRAATQSAGARAYGLAIRSGALLDADTPLAGRWMLAPQEGGDLVRELNRAKRAEAADFAGNLLSPALIAELEQTEPGAGRVVRLESDPRPANEKVAGSPPWRRAEPDNDPVLAMALAHDVARWLRACEG